jgi:hypothetical protein
MFRPGDQNRVTHDFPPAVPEIPDGDISEAAAYYENNLGFKLDWGGEDGGIAGISKGQCRMFLTNSSFRMGRGNAAPILVWLNLHSKDNLYVTWKQTDADCFNARG